MRHRSLLLLAVLFCASSVLAQQHQTSPGVGNAVLLATNSIQIDQEATVVSGDVIVNNATVGPFLGEAALSLDRLVTTPAGYKLAATSVDLDRDAAAGGDVYFNTLSNQGTIAGGQFTPLALPVYSTLPEVFVRPPGSNNVVVPNGRQVTLAEGAYGNLIIGNNGTVHLTGGSYAFASITIGNNGSLRYAAPADVVVRGRADFGANSFVGPETGSGLTASAIRIQVDGINGSSGAMTATPPAVHVDQNADVFANLYATAGSIVIDQGVDGTGAFLARDIRVGRHARLTTSSAFNLPPAANPQTVFTSGTAPLVITLTGSDPEGGALTFSIVSGPSAGTLSSPVQASPTSANVTYTPSAAGVADSFTFRVRDVAGATGDAVVTINPTPDEPPPTPTTVVATDSSAETAKDVPATLLLRGTAPAGVSLTFSIVPSTGPFHGSLGAVVQGTASPQRTATVVYTPDAGFTGSDSFQFQACGVIASVTVCDTASFSITVQAVVSEPPPVLAHDVEVSTPAETVVVISLGGTSIETAGRRFTIRPMAAMLDPAEIAGNVADANNDGFGDNANALPGSVPVFMSAGVNQSGGAGSNGKVRMQFEWDLSGIGSANGLQSAHVVLPTHRGTSDSLDTLFYWSTASGDGSLTNSDFEAPAERIHDAIMTVPASMPIGTDGTFSFSVLQQLRTAANDGHSFFVIQGRVDESLAGPARGLEVRTTASGNVGSNNVPMLSLTTPGVIAPLLYRVTSLPAGGVLRDSSNVLITTVPYDLPSPQVSYEPNVGFLGLDSFSFDVSNGLTSASALARITVIALDCRTTAAGCNNGR
ncbi:MAG: Ig-like domain-containing protein [Acidobacteriota bacterium]